MGSGQKTVMRSWCILVALFGVTCAHPHKRTQNNGNPNALYDSDGVEMKRTQNSANPNALYDSDGVEMKRIQNNGNPNALCDSDGNEFKRQHDNGLEKVMKLLHDLDGLSSSNDGTPPTSPLPPTHGWTLSQDFSSPPPPQPSITTESVQVDLRRLVQAMLEKKTRTPTQAEQAENPNGYKHTRPQTQAEQAENPNGYKRTRPQTQAEQAENPNGYKRNQDIYKRLLTVLLERALQE